MKTSDFKRLFFQYYTFGFNFRRYLFCRIIVAPFKGRNSPTGRINVVGPTKSTNIYPKTEALPPYWRLKLLNRKTFCFQEEKRCGARGGGENCTHASWKPLWWNFHLSFYMAGIRRRVCVLNYGRPCTWCTRLVENNVRGADCVLWSLLLFFNIYFSRSITLYFQIKSGVFHFAENVIRKFIGKRFFRVYYARRVCSRFNNVPIVIFEEIYVLNWKIYVFVGVLCVCVFGVSSSANLFWNIHISHAIKAIWFAWLTRDPYISTSVRFSHVLCVCEKNCFS